MRIFVSILVSAIVLGLLALATRARAENCIASVYSSKYNGSRTASGVPFSNESMTAAHKTIQFGTRALVRRANQSVIVTITDRGPFIRGRCIDLSPAAARAIGMGYTVAPVTVHPLGGP